MKNKIKNYFATPLTKGWLWKWTFISLIISAICSGVTLWKLGYIEDWLKPDSSWTTKE